MPINLSGNELNSLGVKLLNDSSVITSGLLYYWDAGIATSYPGSGSSWTDLTGNGRTITLYNGPTYSTTTGGQLSFDGGDDYGMMTTFNLGNGNVAWTISAWVRTGTSADGLGAGAIFSNSSGGPVYSSIGINSGRISYWSYSGGWFRLIGSTTVNNNLWQHLTWVNRTNTTMDMYVNGIKDLSAGSSPSGNNNPIDIIGGSWTAKFAGIIANAKVYNVAFSDAQVIQDFASQRVRFGR
jgi:hypothetical protein